MAQNSPISWTDKTWNPVRGCSKVSEGCRNCYAMQIAARFSGPGMAYEGLAKRRSNGEAQWTGELLFVEHVLDQPLRWKAPARIFVNSMSDLFHEALDDETLDRIFAVMVLAHQHTFQILTKRPQRMRDYFANEWRFALIEGAAQKLYHERTGEDPSMWLAVTGPLDNVWLGVSVENQAAAHERVPLLLQTPAAVRWLSCEPLLGHVDLTKVGTGPFFNALTGWELDTSGVAAVCPAPMLDWVVAGGESGRNHRGMDIEWLRSLGAQCRAARVPFFAKQDSGSKSEQRGRIPDDVWVHQFPGAAAVTA